MWDDLYFRPVKVGDLVEGVGTYNVTTVEF